MRLRKNRRKRGKSALVMFKVLVRQARAFLRREQAFVLLTRRATKPCYKKTNVRSSAALRAETVDPEVMAPS